ncbi:MAG: hypothetical protein K8W52_08225 [Deltaproteobacteria bacterium]|nr:hypothetical protein [Deltaproteobacteria bacterium]
MIARALVIVGVLGAAAQPGRAACDPKLIGEVFGQPGLGGGDIPINTAVLFSYPGTAAALAHPDLTLFTEAGAVVDSTLTELPTPGPGRHVFLLVPKQPLAPLTKYRIGDAVNWDCTAEPCEATLVPKWVFTTGTATDTTPPLPPIPSVASTVADTCADGSCCGPFHAQLTYLANPASGAVRYDLYDNGVLIETDAPLAISTVCAQAGDVTYHSLRDTVPLAVGTHHLTMRAYDMANNETIGTQVLDLALACPAPPAPDAGVPGPDAGAPADGDGGGCCAAGGSARGSLTAFALLLVVRRRRRHPAAG